MLEKTKEMDTKVQEAEPTKVTAAPAEDAETRIATSIAIDNSRDYTGHVSIYYYTAVAPNEALLELMMISGIKRLEAYSSIGTASSRSAYDALSYCDATRTLRTLGVIGERKHTYFYTSARSFKGLEGTDVFVVIDTQIEHKKTYKVEVNRKYRIERQADITQRAFTVDDAKVQAYERYDIDFYDDLPNEWIVDEWAIATEVEEEDDDELTEDEAGQVRAYWMRALKELEKTNV